MQRRRALLAGRGVEGTGDRGLTLGPGDSGGRSGDSGGRSGDSGWEPMKRVPAREAQGRRLWQAPVAGGTDPPWKRDRGKAAWRARSTGHGLLPGASGVAARMASLPVKGPRGGRCPVCRRLLPQAVPPWPASSLALGSPVGRAPHPRVQGAARLSPKRPA